MMLGAELTGNINAINTLWVNYLCRVSGCKPLPSTGQPLEAGIHPGRQNGWVEGPRLPLRYILSYVDIYFRRVGYT